MSTVLEEVETGDERSAAVAPERRSWLARTTRLRRAGGLSDEDDLVAAGLVDDVDLLAPFNPAILAIRWGTTAVSVALSVPFFIDADWTVVAWCGVIMALTIVRTARPLEYNGDTRSLVAVLGEVAIPVLAVASTGYWDSPFVFSLVTATIVAGFSRGFGFGLRVAGASALAVAIPDLASDGSSEAIRTSAQWVVVMLMVALVAGYARRISGEADRQHSVALDRLGRLADANALLFSLHRVTQTLPASFDLDEVLDTTVTRLRGLFDYDAAVILLLDDTDSSMWLVARRDGTRLPERIPTAQLPPPLLEVVTTQSMVAQGNLLREGGPGLVPSTSSGLYTPLRARGAMVGLLSIEHGDAHHFSARDVELLNGFVEPAALAIDNARWFSRLRTVGADEERTRIARDLHDRIGQSLAYLAFELDRIVTADTKGDAVGPSLEQLRGDVRGVIREVRDTLYDLRTDVSESQDMADTIEAYAKRVAERSSLEVRLFADRGARLPILQEREMWRIAQEALTNVERHARASKVRVVWRCNGTSAALEVLDDGIGFPEGRAGRLDSYGIVGMRERASSIGARLELVSAQGKGTRVRCLLQGG
ncbi:MAG: GAF domain-containing sensor histidine kinase [Acidimicrobiales bacterium]|nr:GAF domain-containing sensor histidine kinase [Acidimicrobiales bacterium]MCB1014821.1 GAF domain-containing sensor histidine kinase [Acidimicrobiales bacterium]MCB9372563.1 GAF domain-containing sensor histidine kinase [Microthrixaceae bacterium]